MFEAKEISATLVAKYAAAQAAGQYKPRTNGTRLDLKAGDTVTLLPGACDLFEGEFENTATGKKELRSWPVVTVKIDHADGSSRTQQCSVSNISRGAFLIGKPDKDGKCKFSDLQPRLGTRGYVLVAENGVLYVPNEVILGKIQIAKEAYQPSRKNTYPKGVNTLLVEKVNDLAYIPAE